MADTDIPAEFLNRYEAKITNAFGRGWLVWDYDFDAPAQEDGAPLYFRTRYEAYRWIMFNQETAGV